MKLILVGRVVALALLAGGLAIALAWASLLVEFSRSDGLLRYPGAQRLAPTDLKLDTLTRGYVSQSSAYQTPDNPARVLGWYVRRSGVGQRGPKGAMDGCLTLARAHQAPFARLDVAVTLCSQRTGRTLIFVKRSLVMR